MLGLPQTHTYKAIGMAKESGLRQRVGALLREHGFFVQAIESETNPGMPDLYYRKRAYVVGWLELKRIKELPKRSATSLFKSLNHPLLTEQINWIASELDHDGTADILVAYERRYFLVPGELAADFNSFTFTDLCRYELPKSAIPERLSSK